MRVFLVGDYRTGTGPANVTLAYDEYLQKSLTRYRHQDAVNKVARAIELAVRILNCDVVLMSGYSKQNLLTIKLAKMFRKKTAYLMHGCVEHENSINGVPDVEMNRVERATMAGTDLILAVSETFSVWLALHYPELADKIQAQPNGLKPEDVVRRQSANVERLPHRIMSIGGGMPRKKIKYICQAVEQMRRNEAYADTELIVIGAEGLDTEEINSYSFVKNLGLVPYKQTEELLRSSQVFVQNSCFETFGLAPVEALVNGASVLLSKHIGALELFEEITDGDLINEYDNPAEISGKITNLCAVGNADRLLDALDTESVSWERRTKQLIEALEQLIEA